MIYESLLEYLTLAAGIVSPLVLILGAGYQYLIKNCKKRKAKEVEKIKRILGRDGFLVAVTSLFYGWQLFWNPGILENYRVYDIVDSIVNNHWIGLAFMITGLVKIIGVVFSIPLFRKIGLVTMSFLWGMFFISFLMSPPPNTVWVLSWGIVMILIRTSIREDG